MNFDSGTAYAESDADDEYERDPHGSSPTATDVETSPIDSEPPSAEHTPTTYGYHTRSRLPETLISEWTAEECADFIATIGVQKYADRFIENDIVGEALVALHHDDLKAMGITSAGHRLAILKSVYDVKKAQDVPIEPDHYHPPTAEVATQSNTATIKDIKQLVEQLRLRDERMALFEQDLRKLTEDFKRLREDMLPALRLVKDAQQPLPAPNGYENTLSPPGGGQGVGIKRQYSTKKIMLGATPKASSPTHLQTTHDRSMVEQTLDPQSAADRAVMSSSHLAAMNGSTGSATSPSYPSPNMPSPTSPPTTLSGTTLASRSYRSDQPTPPPARSNYADDHYKTPQTTTTATTTRRNPDTPGGGNQSVEIFKSFRVSMDDPCYKVLPAALKKYQINAPWDQYALYIVYGDQERCLGLDEKPLILFKQLDKEGKKPMFMLRKTTQAQQQAATAAASQAAQEAVAAANATAASSGGGYDPPGGII
ncbi:uncharacterized protein CTHT_0026480 [Thermochaetoides thermophila DSM 1495]|uniref:Uncharacterized protein n=1 Tax=Chaetomium thermophilum (strain DSM 1495 / CBS 144.50 / IMI 039719) TaxID=759272 RepID=G0S6J9_CHATD|nr:hypothetical protein CTHT_0026480 [Thermochaetoides thermophila DSM 1495]EGS20810.1 hypothetical protein CTHT_0026480 [Thermochaetoides thermophila DSM 1495]